MFQLMLSIASIVQRDQTSRAKARSSLLIVSLKSPKDQWWRPKTTSLLDLFGSQKRAA